MVTFPLVIFDGMVLNTLNSMPGKGTAALTCMFVDIFLYVNGIT